MTTIKTIELDGVLDSDPSVEDGGCAMITDLLNKEGNCSNFGDMFLRFHSWDESATPKENKHQVLKSLLGKKLKITIEVLD